METAMRYFWQHPIPWLSRLSFRQAISSLIIALVIGLLLSGISIGLDFSRAQEELENRIQETVEIVRQPAVQAAYSLDAPLAQDIIKGLLAQPMLMSVSLLDDEGQPLATLQRPPDIQRRPLWFENWLSPVREYRFPLFMSALERLPVGELRLSVDNRLAFQGFFARSGYFLIEQLCRNVLVTLCLLWLFHYLVTKPLQQIAHSLQAIDPRRPGQHRVFVEPSHQRDEIGWVAESTNNILNAIEQAATERLAAEQRYREMFLNAPIGLFHYHLRQGFTHVNPAMVFMLRYQDEAQLTHQVFLSSLLLNDEIPLRIERLLQQSDRVQDLEVALRCADGETIYGALSLHRSNAVEQLFEGVLIDVTARKHAKDALRELNETLERRIREEVSKNREKDHLLIQQSRLAAMGEMVHNIAHQWRQPLNALGLVVANIRDAWQFGDMNDEFLASEESKAQRLLQKMSATIDDFRAFFQPDASKSEFTLQSAVCSALDLLSAVLANQRIHVEVRGDENIKVYGYPHEYAQILLNLLTNAKEALTERAIPQATIWIEYAQEDGLARLSVRDNAGGISEQVLSKVFDPYFTTKPHNAGIGLYMAKMIVAHSMGGRILVNNQNDGAEFVLETPLVPVSLDEKNLTLLEE